MKDNEYNEIVKEIDFEEKWLFDVYVKQYRINIKDVEIALAGIRSIAFKLKGENNDCNNQKTGHWIEREIEDTMRWKECSECHSEYPNMNGLKYCPNCGAKMEELKGENK